MKEEKGRKINSYRSIKIDDKLIKSMEEIKKIAKINYIKTWATLANEIVQNFDFSIQKRKFQQGGIVYENNFINEPVIVGKDAMKKLKEICEQRSNDYVAMEINFNVKIESEHELDDLLKINGLTKYVDLNYTRSEIEKRWPFLKKLWASGMSFYSYSVKKINDYFGREVLQKDTPTMSAYVINYLIDLYNREKYWDKT